VGFCTDHWRYDNRQGVTQVSGEHLDTYKCLSPYPKIIQHFEFAIVVLYHTQISNSFATYFDCLGTQLLLSLIKQSHLIGSRRVQAPQIFKFDKTLHQKWNGFFT
jgi:hypothetical protein